MKNMRVISRFVTAAIFCVILTTFTVLPIRPAYAEEGNSTVVHLSQYSNDLHAVFMALKIAGMLKKKGDPVVLFVDLEGVRLADDRVPDDMKWGQSDADVAALYTEFVKAGGEIKVCPHCAKAAGLGAENLRSGASVLTSEELAELLSKASKVIDY
jgi:predicted peroxiredoxin